MIPFQVRAEIASDPWYRRCCLTGRSTGKIDHHHCFKYGKSQIQERWNIVPVIHEKHQTDNDAIHNGGTMYKELAQLAAIERAIQIHGDIEYLNNKYPRYDRSWTVLYTYLRNKYPDFNWKLNAV